MIVTKIYCDWLNDTWINHLVTNEGTSKDYSVELGCTLEKIVVNALEDVEALMRLGSFSLRRFLDEAPRLEGFNFINCR